MRRGQGYTLRVTVVPIVHRRLLALCQPLDGGQGTPAVPAQRKARHEYENRVSALALYRCSPIAFALAYTERTREDYAAFTRAIDEGRLPSAR
ncbi:hypothetical protein GCM10010335_11840 [Streptomyces galbus]|nr:hypothetical protein GCM10010335_11840 [Streptomyces galbus]